MDMRVHEKWFDGFVEEKICQSEADAEPLLVKKLHTKNVLENCRAIACAEGFAPRLAHACELAGLYHDLARFDQYLQFGTFKDKQSRNHGSWAVQLLKRYGRLNDEENKVKRLVLTAIAFHNHRALPKSLAGQERLICEAVRDADKIDIIRVMDEHLSGPGPYNPTVILGLPDAPGLYSPKVIACALVGRAASYDDLFSVNDFRVLLGSWYYELGFAASRARLVGNGHVVSLVAALPARGAYAEARSRLLGDLGAVG